MRSHPPALRAALASLLLLGSCKSTRQPPEPATADVPPRVTTPPPADVPQLPPPAPRYVADIVARVAHDPQAFTQGLAFYQGKLFESTGLNGESTLRELDPASGRVLRRREIAAEHFAEGLTVLNGRIYQITWRSQICFVYDAVTLQPVAEHRYRGEGWGLTHDGRNLILSDGTDRLRFFDPATFAEQRSVRVRDGERSIDQLNELEMIDGEVYANIWHDDRIARIDPATGRVVGWIDAGPVHASMNLADPEAVTNGIAWEPLTHRLILTGKLWPAMFEVRLRRVGERAP